MSGGASSPEVDGPGLPRATSSAPATAENALPLRPPASGIASNSARSTPEAIPRGRWRGNAANPPYGGRIKIDASKGLKVDNAMLIKPDMAASNGVIHVVDTVLMPK